MCRQRPIRIASVPSGHVYVRHLADPDHEDGVVRLADPLPCGAPSTSVRWWPPVMLDPQWIDENHHAFDVFHLHFGFDTHGPESLAAIVSALRRRRKPLVFTVHDLHNPHQPDTMAHQAQLDVLVPAADALVTLTPGAAKLIAARWGRPALVIPHPHVVAADDIPARRPRPFTVGLHAKSLRPNMAPLPVLEVLTEVVAEWPDARLRVDIHTEIVEPGPKHVPETVAALREAQDAGLLTLHVHDFFSDEELWRYLTDLDLSVLPYTFGTHSGWLEACHDLGTTVATSTCGFYDQQQPCLTYRHDQSGLDTEALADAVRYAYHKRPSWQADPGERRRQRRRIAHAHRALYERVLTRNEKTRW
ncbi:glycosyltransferase [Amycolatopsis thailandensis]|uniref:glycosyltransferase n=1 Tax=Amycolatopsis thailandensis TaxID=589330 RepID=UPI001FCA4797|nr:glycosyltransferase [Amycolatopsis thailandensis]